MAVLLDTQECTDNQPLVIDVRLIHLSSFYNRVDVRNLGAILS